MQYYFHSSIRNYTLAVTDLFSDIHVPRYNSQGERIEDIIVPIAFGNKDKAYSLSKHDLENLHNGNVNILPRMAISFDSMAKAPARDTNKNAKINRVKNLTSAEKLLYNYQYNASAYDFYYTIYIATRTFTEAAIIVEQIAPLFRPDLTIKIQELDIQDEPTSVPVELQDFAFTLPEALEDDEIRIIEVEFPIIVKGNLYLPIKEQKIIKELEVNTKIIETKRRNQSVIVGIGDDATSELLASILTTSVPEEDLPNNQNEFEEARDKAVTTIESNI